MSGVTIVEQMHQQLAIDSEDIESLEQVLHTAVGDENHSVNKTIEHPISPNATQMNVTSTNSTPTSAQVLVEPPAETAEVPGRLKGQLDPGFDDTIRKYVSRVQQLRVVSPMDDFDPKKSLETATTPRPTATDGEESQPLIPRALKFSDASDDGGDDEEDEAVPIGSSYRPVSSKALLQVAQLVQKLAMRVKSIELNQSLLAGYLINMTSYFQEELKDASQYQEQQLQIKYSQLYKQYSAAIDSTQKLRTGS